MPEFWISHFITGFVVVSREPKLAKPKKCSPDGEKMTNIIITTIIISFCFIDADDDDHDTDGSVLYDE